MPNTNVTHTLGPWEVKANAGTHVPYAIEGNGWTVAEVYWSEYFDNPSEEAEANARLIAAAPDLLAALDALLAVPVTAAHNAGQAYLTTALREARTAIAKARGQA